MAGKPSFARRLSAVALAKADAHQSQKSSAAPPRYEPHAGLWRDGLGWGRRSLGV